MVQKDDETYLYRIVFYRHRIFVTGNCTRTRKFRRNLAEIVLENFLIFLESFFLESFDFLTSFFLIGIKNCFFFENFDFFVGKYIFFGKLIFFWNFFLENFYGFGKFWCFLENFLSFFSVEFFSFENLDFFGNVDFLEKFVSFWKMLISWKI